MDAWNHLIKEILQCSKNFLVVWDTNNLNWNSLYIQTMTTMNGKDDDDDNNEFGNAISFKFLFKRQRWEMIDRI